MYSYLKLLRYLMMCLSEDLVFLLGVWHIEVGVGGGGVLCYFVFELIHFILFTFQSTAFSS